MSGTATSGAEPPPRAPEFDDDPIQRIVADVVERLETLAETPDATLTCDSLIEMIGTRSHALVILIFSLLNLLPGPPGYSLIIGLAIMAFSVMMILGHQIRLWDFVGKRQLPLKLLLKFLPTLSGITSAVAKVSSPRLRALTGHGAIPFLGILGIVLGTGMLVPIPFTNTLPAVGMAAICIGMLNRDGAAVIVGALIGLFGLVLLVFVCWVAFSLTMIVGEAIVD